MYSIKLEIKPAVLRSLLQSIDFEMPEKQDKKTKSYISLLAFVVLKLCKKEITCLGSEKIVKIKLEYFEAFCLMQTLQVVLGQIPDRELQNIFDQLHQKTA